MGKLLEAIEFARIAHEGQKRKYTGEDYIWHPIEVARIVSTVTDDIDMLIAAVLHDTVEDTEVSLEDIETHFGKVVAGYVENLTDVSHADDGLRRHRKEVDRQHTAKAHPNAKTIKLADLISNCYSIYQNDKRFAAVYIKEKELLLEVLTEGDNSLYKVASKLVDNVKFALEIK